MKVQYRKVYVDVILKNDKEGVIHPMSIEFENGEIYQVDKLKHICKAAATKVGGCGTRYTVTISGKETYIFNEDDKWFVEAKDYI